ncbi:MAG: hypothetical protein HDT46_00195 [Ruminococcaceae bacterium]|nr:hypothetical protein [Oscillospiraceae bacterium]
MLKTGIKKELMFFTRSFKMCGIIIAAIVLAVASPLLMKLSGAMISSLDSADIGNASNGNYTQVSHEINATVEYTSLGADYDSMLELFEDENLAYLGIISSFGDLTNTLLLIFMIVTMYSAGGELKKRSMIIPQNAGLTTKLYVLPKFLVYPLAAAVFAFVGVIVSGLVTAIVFNGVYDADIGRLMLVALTAAVYDAFIVTLYFTLGLCTARAGIATIILYGGSAILSVLFTSFGANKFHPFALKDQAQEILIGGEGEIDFVNLFGSIGVTVLIMLLCYFVTIFVISAKRTDNRGEEGIEL